MNILDKYNLNSNQLEAAKHIEGPALVLAGAGSGKTRILTLRILNLVKSKMAGSDQILALTFTNKAADEIKERLNNMLGTEDIFSWMGTFHSISYKILRIFVQELSPDYKRGFTIYDSNDQTKLLKENMEVIVQFYEDQALSIDLPSSVELSIETTDAAIKGQTASSSYKPAILDNGIKIMVPPFINSGDKIALDTRTLEYIKKIK